MASEFARPPPQIPTRESTDSGLQEQTLPYEPPTLNGDTEPTDVGIRMTQDGSNLDSVVANASLDVPPQSIATQASPTPDLNPSGPTPVEDVAPGLQPVADFVPKEASTVSHPTPPPDEPLTSGAADVDVEMANAEPEVVPPTASEPQSLPSQLETSLVRPREDDGDDEPAAKRSRTDEETPVTAEVTETILPDALTPGGVALDTALHAEEHELVPQPMAESTPTPVATTSLSEALAESPVLETKVDPDPTDTQLADAPADSMDATEAAAPITEAPLTATPVDAKPPISLAASAAQAQPAVAPADASKQTYDTEQMTGAQKASLIEKTKNLKKTKNSTFFLKPVDPIALGIPTYPDIIKQPMDLSTLDSKLKGNEYRSVQDYVNDFNLIISNSVRFNGEAHAVTQAGRSVEAYFNRAMESVPSRNAQAAPKTEKRRSPSLPREKRRESGRAVQPPTPTAPAATAPSKDTYALYADGTPQIRRQSSMADRPARAIKPPSNREIPYAKPKRKEHQLELRFCEHVLDEIRSSKHGAVNFAFQVPVDPVALNIPHYRQIIKNPMDLGTMSQKLKNGEYGTAKEFKADFDLIIKNCVTFNPAGNAVRDMAIQLSREFEMLWQTKHKWERQNAPPSARASSASGEDESGVDEEDDDDEEDEKSATIRALQKQLADMQNALSGLGGDKAAKAKKAKSASKALSKKANAIAAAPSSKSKSASKPVSKAKKPKQVTYEEKQEISEAVMRMDEKQVARLTDIIVQNCAKYRDLEEMELEIDDLPSDVQILLLDYVRKIFGNPKKKKVRDPSPDDAAALDDDDYDEPQRGAKGGRKRMKHKPMGKKEQDDAITNIRNQLAQFQQPNSGSESPANDAANAQAETSGDEDSEESEEE